MAIGVVAAGALIRAVLAVASSRTRFLAQRSKPARQALAFPVDVIAALVSVLALRAFLVAVEAEEAGHTLERTLFAVVPTIAVALPGLLVAVRIVSALTFLLARRTPQTLLTPGFAAGTPPVGFAFAGACDVVAPEGIVQLAVAGECTVLTVAARGTVLIADLFAIARSADALSALSLAIPSVVADALPDAVGSVLSEWTDALTRNSVVTRWTAALTGLLVAINTLAARAVLETSLAVESCRAHLVALVPEEAGLADAGAVHRVADCTVLTVADFAAILSEVSSGTRSLTDRLKPSGFARALASHRVAVLRVVGVALAALLAVFAEKAVGTTTFLAACTGVALGTDAFSHRALARRSVGTIAGLRAILAPVIGGTVVLALFAHISRRTETRSVLRIAVGVVVTGAALLAVHAEVALRAAVGANLAAPSRFADAPSVDRVARGVVLTPALALAVVSVRVVRALLVTQRTAVAGGALACARLRVAARAVLATAALIAILAVLLRWALLVAGVSGPAALARAFPGLGVARGSVLARAGPIAALAPESRGAVYLTLESAVAGWTSTLVRTDAISVLTRRLASRLAALAVHRQRVSITADVLAVVLVFLELE